MFGMQYHHSCDGIAAVHERGRSLQYLHGMHSLGIYLQSVLIAPLLSLLPYALVHHHYTVISESSDDGFAYSCSCGYLRHAGLT